MCDVIPEAKPLKALGCTVLGSFWFFIWGAFSSGVLRFRVQGLREVEAVWIKDLCLRPALFHCITVEHFHPSPADVQFSSDLSEALYQHGGNILQHGKMLKSAVLPDTVLEPRRRPEANRRSTRLLAQ